MSLFNYASAKKLFYFFLLFCFLITNSFIVKGSINPELFIAENPKYALIELQKSFETANIQGDKPYQIALLLSITQAQINIYDSEKAEKSIELAYQISNEIKSDSITVKIQLIHSQIFLQKGNWEQVEKIIEKSLILANSTKNSALRVETLLSIGDLYQRLGKTNMALSSKNEALSVAITNGYTNIDNVYHSIARTYWQSSRFEEALQNYKLALELREKQTESNKIVSSLRNIGLVLRDLGKLSESREVLQKALALSQKEQLISHSADILNLMGSLLAKEGKHIEALGMYTESLNYRIKLGLLQSSASTLDNIARSQKELSLFSEAIGSLNRSLQLRQEIGDSKGEAASLNELGNLFSQQNNLSDALRYYLQSLRIRQRLGQPSDISRSLTNIGLVYRKLNSLENALKYFTNALEMTQIENDPMGVSYLQIHVGNTLKELGKSREALVHFHKALDLRRKTSNKLQEASVIRSIANTHADLREYNVAIGFLNQALAMFRELKDTKGEADTYNDLGNIAQYQMKTKEALVYFEKAAELFNITNDLEKKGLCYRKIGEIHALEGNIELSNKYLNNALAIAKLTQNAKLLELTIYALYTNLNKQGNYRDALNQFLKYSQIKDSLNRITEKESIIQMSVELELGKKMDEIRQIEAEIELLKTEAELKSAYIDRQMLIRNFMLVSIVLLALLVIAIAYGYIAFRKANRKLIKSEQELKQTVATKDKLFSIIAHDLRSPFNALAGLTEVFALQAETLNADEIKEYSQSVHEASINLLALTDNLLHWSRTQTGNIVIKPKNISLNDLINNALSSVQLQAAQKDILIESTIEPQLSAFVDWDTMNTVLRNIASNAVKFTNPNGKVLISASKMDHSVVIEISDNGIGMDQNQLTNLFKLDKTSSTKGTKNETGTGIGLIVCKEFIELNGGQLKVNSSRGLGSKFTIIFPQNIEKE